MKIPFLKQFQLSIIYQIISVLNFILFLFNKLLFNILQAKPRNILIYKIGNIGDVVCAIPSFIAIRRAYPQAKITLLSSPGKKGALGAKELLSGVWYINELKIYYTEDIDSLKKKTNFIRDLRKNHYDLFIQLPDDLANFRTLFRNMIFAKLLKVKSSFGFKIRTIQLFKKTQVNYSFQKTEVESLLDLLRENNIIANEVEFDFNISKEQKFKIKKIFQDKWGKIDKQKIVVAISPGCKRETNQWPTEHFAKIAKYLQDKYNAKIIVIGGKDDINKAEIIRQGLKSSSVLILAGKTEFLETVEVLKYCTFLISNSTGNIHLAAAVALPSIGLYSIRDVFGRWFPYGPKNKVLYHKFLNCDYRKEGCIEKSIKMISVDEVKIACDQMINFLLKKNDDSGESKKVVFLDRDGVINKKMPENDYVKRWDEFEFLPGAIEALKLLNNQGYKIFIITNQRGIARGMMSEESLMDIHLNMQKELMEHDIMINGIYYCPHNIIEECECRKPKPGMFFQAAKEHSLNLKKSFFIGDSESDFQAGEAAGCNTIIIKQEKSLLQVVEEIIRIRIN